jgi:holliday junction DNA helicase RuvA
LIGSLHGRLVEKGPGEILLETGGVGYRVAVPLTTYGRLPATGSSIALTIHTHVREDAITLYGFDSRRERDLFERLIGVPGIGPRLALALLSHMEPRTLAEAVRSRDTERLTRVPGIGQKTAERLIVELGSLLKEISDLDPGSAGAGTDTGRRGDVISALVNLGYRTAQAAPVADEVLGSAAAGEPVESLLREALRRLAAPQRARASAGRESA